MPVGKHWHVRQPAATPAKTNRKLADIDRAAAKKARRLARMDAVERAAYAKWEAAHRPGDPAARAARRERRRQNDEARKMIRRAGERAECDKSASKLDEQIAELRAELETRQQFRTGVFA